MNGLPREYCMECKSTAEFRHCYFNSGCKNIKEYCKTFCTHSEHYIKLFGKRESNKIKRKMGLIK